jgi:hypothetical protein
MRSRKTEKKEGEERGRRKTEKKDGEERGRRKRERESLWPKKTASCVGH